MKRQKLMIAALFLILPFATNAGPIDLADIVGGGDGTGTGTLGTGIHQGTGGTVTGCSFSNTSNTINTYQTVASSDFIDGVFIPDGGSGPVQVASDGTTSSAIGDSANGTWDYIINGSCASGGSGGYYGLTPSGLTSQITFHANNGITFDLDAIEAANPGFGATSFSALAALTNASSDGAEFMVLVDGISVWDFLASSDGLTQELDVSLNPDDRFLTLVTTDRGTSYFFDQTLFGDPILTLSPTSVPEPATLALLGLGLVGMAARRRKAV